MAETSTPARTRLPWPIAAVVVALAVAAALLLLVGRERRPPPGKTWDRPLEPVAQVRAVQGTVHALRGDERRALAAQQTVYIGEGVEAASGASLSMTTYPAGATLGLGSGQLFFESPSEIRVDAGRVQADIGTAVTVLITPHGRVTGLETRLSVEVTARGTQVDVQRGDALVEESDMKQRLRPGARLFLSAHPAAAVERDR